MTLPRDGTRRASVEVWCIDLEAGADLLIDEAARRDLAPAATGQGDAAARDVHRVRTAARSALRLILAGYVGCDTARRPFLIARGGKPALDIPDGDRSVAFSLAHSDTAAVVAISREGPVGIDIEGPRAVRINPQRRELLMQAAIALSPRQPLPDGPGEARFLQAWVRLEALAKATGEGLGALLGRLEDAASPPSATQVNGVPVRVRDIDLGNRALWAALAATSFGDAGDRAPQPLWLPLDAGRLEAWVRSGVTS